MKTKMIMLVTFILLAILTIGAVSANDDGNNLTAMKTHDTITLDGDDVDTLSDPEDDDDPEDPEDPEDPDDPEDPEDPEEGELSYRIYVAGRYDIHHLDSKLISYSFYNCGEGGNITISIDGELCKSYAVDSYYGEVELSAKNLGLTNLTYKNYTVEISYSGDDKLEGFNQTHVFRGDYGFYAYIENGYSDEEDPDIEIRWGESIEFVASLPDDAKGNLVYEINGRKYSIPANELEYDNKITSDKLDVGNNEIKFSYVGDDYPLDYMSENVTVYLHIECGESYINYNESTFIYLNTPLDANGNLSVYEVVLDEDENIIDHTLIRTVPVENGFANVSLTNFKIGKYEIYANYTGSDYPVTFSPYGYGHITLYVNPIVNVASKIRNNTSNNLTITFPEEYEGILRLTIGEEERSVNVTNGKGSIELFNIDSCDHTYEWSDGYATLHIELEFEGDDCYYREFYKIFVSNTNPDFNFTISMSETILKGSEYEHITLWNSPKDAGENFMAYIDGNPITPTITHYDDLRVNISSLDLGTHTLRVDYLGNDYYKPASANCTFEIVDVVMLIDDDKIYVGNYSDYMPINYFAGIQTIYDDGYYTLIIDGETAAMGFVNDKSDYYHYKQFYTSNSEEYKAELIEFTRGIHNVELIYTRGDLVRSINKTITAVYDIHGTYEDEYLEGENINLYFTVPLEVSGNLNVTLDGQQHIIPIVNGKANLTISNITVGNHQCRVRYAGDEYPEIYEAYGFTVKGKSYGISSNSNGLKYGDDLIILAQYPNDFVGKLYVYETIDGAKIHIQTVDIVNGSARVTIPNLTYGEYEIGAKIIDYDEDPEIPEDPDNDPYSNTFYPHIMPVLNGENSAISCDFQYGETDSQTVTVELQSDANGVLYLYKENPKNKGELIKIDEIDVVGGNAIILLNNFTLGSNSFYYTYDDGKYNISDYFATVNINPKMTYPKEMNFGDEEYLTIYAPSGNLSAFGMNTTVVDGVAKISLSNLPVGSTKLDFIFKSDTYYWKYYNPVWNEISKSITVHKPKPSIYISDSADPLIVELDEDATGSIIVTVGNKSFASPLVEGMAVIEGLNADSNEDILLEYCGNQEYGQFKKSVKLGETYASKINADLRIDAQDINEGETAIISFTINKNATGNILVQIDDINKNATITNGSASISIAGLAVGTYTVTAKYDGTDDIRSQTRTASFRVKSLSIGTFSQLAALIENTTENGILELDKDYQNDESIANSGIAISKAMTIDGKGHILDASKASRVFNIQADNVTLKNVVFKDGYSLNKGGALYFASGGSVVNCSFIGCSAREGGAIYVVGTSTVRISSSYFENNSAQNSGGAAYGGIIFDCDFKNNTAPEVDSENNYAQIVQDQLNSSKNGVIILEFPIDAEGTIEVFLNDTSIAVIKIINGIAMIDLSNYSGKYVLKFIYSGDANYPSFSKDSNVTINVKTPIISAGNVKVLYTAGQKYTITVYESKGVIASGAKVTIKANGKAYKTITTSSSGIASFNVAKVPGTYKLTITALGKTVTKTLTVKHLVTLKTVKVKRSAKKLVLTATLSKVNKKYLKNKKITFKFKGKKYTAKTNKKGVAKVTVKSSVLKKLKAGKKVTYQATYLKDTVKKTVKINK